MSEIEPTQPGNFEPTQPASYNPYDIYPYSDVPELPPPPPKRRRKWARLLTTMLLVVFAGTVSGLSLVYLYEQSHRNVVQIIVPHISKSTKVATPTPTPDPTHPLRSRLRKTQTIRRMTLCKPFKRLACQLTT